MSVRSDGVRAAIELCRFYTARRNPPKSMKRILLLLALGFLSAAAPRTSRAAEVTVDVFYNQLEPYGDWIDAGEYGYAWHPRDVAEDWRPYTDGRWAYTDAGWTWVSEEPYSWAVYHYGRWAQVADVGWIWVPGTEWGPAWVSFRRSKKHIGWAPLPPEARLTREVRTISTWSDSYYDVGPTHYIFVETRNFGSRHLRDSVLPPRENVIFIRETTNITNIRVENNVIFNGGPEYAVITRETTEPIERLRIERRTEFVESDRTSYRTEVQGGSVRFAAPIFATAVAASFTPAKVSRKLERVEVNRGWKDVADPAAAQQLRTKMKAETKAPPALPPAPKFEKASLLAAPITAPAMAAPTEKPAPTSAEKSAPMPAEKTPATTATSEAKPANTDGKPAVEPKPAPPAPPTPAVPAAPPEKMDKKPAPVERVEPPTPKPATDTPPPSKPADATPAPRPHNATPKATPATENAEPTATPKPPSKAKKNDVTTESTPPPPSPKKAPRAAPPTPAEPVVTPPKEPPVAEPAPSPRKGKKPENTEPPIHPQTVPTVPDAPPAERPRDRKGKGKDTDTAPAPERPTAPERSIAPPEAPAPKKHDKPEMPRENPRPPQAEPVPRNAAPTAPPSTEKAPVEKEKKGDRKKDSTPSPDPR